MVTSNLITLHRVSVAEANKLHDCLQQRLYPDLFLSHMGDCRMLEDNAQLKKALVQTKSRLVCDAILGLAGVKSLPGGEWKELGDKVMEYLLRPFVK